MEYKTHMTRFVQYYDEHKKDLLGSFNVLQLDGRKNLDKEINELISSNLSTINKYNDDITKNGFSKIIKPDKYYLRVFTGSILNPIFLTGFIDINRNIPISKPSNNDQE